MEVHILQQVFHVRIGAHLSQGQQILQLLLHLVEADELLDLLHSARGSSSALALPLR